MTINLVMFSDWQKYIGGNSSIDYKYLRVFLEHNNVDWLIDYYSVIALPRLK